ncbi:hypothetical protein [Cytobacillus kochii]|uniref:hypothetical protein n=1 Tax=Cytobacillus kochii TaxID=859143 RepID=UPI003850AC53
MGNESFGLAFSLANMGTVRVLSVHFMDFENNNYYMNFSSCPLLENSSHKMPLDTQGDAEFESESPQCRYIRTTEFHCIGSKLPTKKSGLFLFWQRLL